jgi:ADP-dependent NAD(P)H-hydrate dehydratase / NAD(P)H-hydrate epimerase
MKILTAAEMGAADRRSVEAGVSVGTLMQHAGEAVARFCLRRFGGEGLVVVLAGKGNNGGDGMVAALRLAEAGRQVRVALLGKASELKGEAEQAWESVTHLSDDEAVAKMARPGNVAKMGHPVSVEVREIEDEAGLRVALEGAALVIDAVVGTGFKPPLRGLAATAQEMLAESGVPVVAVDLPSGWDADSMAEKAEGAFRADAVVTFTAPKLAHVFGHLTAATFGPVVVAGIGTPEGAIESASGLTWGGSVKAIAETPRAINGNKGRLGHVLLVGGSYGKAGAPSMASLAALRAGAGLVTAAVPREILPIVAAVAPELMLTPLEEQGSGSRVQGSGFEVGGLALDQLESEALKTLLKGISVAGIGPGLGQEGTTPQWVRTFVGRVTLPMVIDADALNALAGRTSMLKDAARKGRTIVLTPHPGEMARLVEMSIKEVEADRVGLARRFATEHGVTLVLKGWRTLVAHPDGRVAVNTTGNPSMAKGGSGDILTGIVCAMLAQYAGAGESGNVAEAVEAAVFLHGLAGDFACLAQDEHTVLATDTVGHLWQAFRARVEDADGLTWIAGTAANGIEVAGR